jgi:hypothetical protein
MGDLVAFIQKNFIIIPILLVLGILLGFFGIKFVKATLAILGFCSAFGILALLLNSMLNLANKDTKTQIIALVVCALVGFIVGGVFYYLTNLTFVLAGGALGYIIGTIVIGLIAIKFAAIWLTIGVYIVMVGLGLLLGHYLHDFVVVLTTSVFGGFLMVLAAGSAIGNYPSYMTLSE